MMKDGPSIAPVAALVGDPARANMLAALVSGMALTASELAGEAGVALQTASSHLAKLKAGGLVAVTKQGRHRYVRLANHDVAEMLEAIMGVAARAGHLRARPGPRDTALRKARVCYDHLAGEMGVRMLDSLLKMGRVARDGADLRLTRRGETFMRGLRIDVDTLFGVRRPICKPCLDWSMRREHLAGGLGAALLTRFHAVMWVERDAASRAVRFTRSGEAAFLQTFALTT